MHLVRCLPCNLLLLATLAFPPVSWTQAEVSSAAKVDSLETGFLHPPASARPRVWWHWMNGNITPVGLELDLEWMKRAGLGGVTVFEGSLDTPQVVPKRLIYMTPDWKQAFNGALNRANRVGFEFGIASSPGWSETGAPWVPPSQGMKKLVWSGMRVEGGRSLCGDSPAASAYNRHISELQPRGPTGHGGFKHQAPNVASV